MTPAQFASYVRKLTRCNATTFPDADILLFANIEKDELAPKIVDVDEDFFGVPQTFDLVEDQREYPLPDELLKSFKFVEAKLDETNWIRLKEFDLIGFDLTTDEDTIVANFGNEKDKAFFDLFRKSLWIYSGSITNVTGGLKIWSFDYPADLTSLAGSTDMSVDPSTTSAGIPRQLHKIWALRVSRAYKENREKPIPLSQQELNLDFLEQQALKGLRNTNLNRAFEATVPYNDGSEY